MAVLNAAKNTKKSLWFLSTRLWRLFIWPSRSRPVGTYGSRLWTLVTFIEFDDYASDMSDMIASFDLSKYAKRYSLAHSMGSTIATRHIYKPIQTTHLIRSPLAPMFGGRTTWVVLKAYRNDCWASATAFHHAKTGLRASQQAYYSKPLRE